MINAREASIKALYDINNDSLYSQIVIKNYDDNILKLEDRNLFRELVYGVLENQMFLDYIIKDLSKIRFNKIHPLILEILRIGLYQLFFSDRIPESAAVNESVKLAKKYGHKGSIGFVNGILRNANRRKEEFLAIELSDSNEKLSIRYSHPIYLIEKWIEQYGKFFTLALLKANNSSPKLNIRVNTLKTDKKSLEKSLKEKGLDVIQCKFAKDCLILNNPNRVTETDEFKNGLFTIQDESSMLVTEVMQPKEKSSVLDICSAPGGKSTHIAQWMNNNGQIIARDLSYSKLDLIKDNIDRLGIDIIETQHQDALDLDKKSISKFDYCLVDAPCSGFGLLRRKPEIKFNKTKDDIESLIDLQSKILKIASEYVKPNGYLIYSTCTINKDENIKQIENFIKQNQEFELVPIVLESDMIISPTQGLGYIELFPNIHGTDGFFIAKMIKKDSLYK
ncbi:MAG: 16S rRNA (cytosine(967)-C(5))-methyltransferase RsmB [Gudongella sp.]|nr:16S rRNA (cytosine(967)-C(5))-methyltransferase RsmB [Gudongella sp.]